MPLVKSASKAAVSANIKRELESGKPRAQAIAIALDVQRRNRAFGGALPMLPGQPSATPDMQNQPVGLAPMMQGPASPQAPPMAMGAMQGIAPPPQMLLTSQTPPMGPPQVPQLAIGGPTGVGGFNVAKEAHMRPSYVEGAEMRHLMRGPILSAVPGRTDAHKSMVPANSYVLPADIISGRGQGNTLAGMNIFQRMFKMGPYGTAPGGIRPGHSMPAPMHAPKMLAAGGDASDEHGNKLVPVNLAGGELVIPPENLTSVVHPNIKVAHELMDRFVIHERKKLRKTLAKLPGPAKD